MDGTNLILQVRKILRDRETETEKGLFWSDAEILLALNAAQDSFINFCLLTKTYNSLSSLVRKTTPATTIDLSTLPIQDRYMHYASAYITEGNEYRLARLYLGGEGLTYSNSTHDFCFIENNEVSFFSLKQPAEGVLVYFTYPERIDTTPSTTKSFPIDYYDVMVKHAAFILGMKETLTSRSIKLKSNFKQRIVVTPRQFIHHIIDKDITVERSVPQEETGRR